MKATAVIGLLLLAGNAAAQQISLGQAAKEVSAFSYQIKSRAAAVDAAKAGIDKTQAMRMPKLSYQSALTSGDDPVYVFGSLLRQDSFTQSHFDVDKLNNPSPRTNFYNALSLEVPLFTGFAISDSRALNQNYAAQGQSVLAYTLQAEVFGAAQNYLNLALKTELAKIASETELSTKDELKTADRLKSRGFILGSDYYAAQSVLSSISAARSGFELDILAESSALAVRMGRDPQTRLQPLAGFAPFSYTLPKQEEQLAKIAQERGDILAARMEAKNAEIAKDMEKNSILPQIGLFAQLQTNTRDFSSNPFSNTVGVNMNIAFGDFTRASRIKEREAQKEQALQQSLALSNTASADLLRYRAQYESAKAALPAAQQAVKNAQQSLELFKPLFRQGRQSVLEVVRAEAALMAARNTLAEITFKMHFYYAAALFTAGEFDQTTAEKIGAALSGGTK